MSGWRRVLLASAGAFASVLGLAYDASAATFEVDTTTDSASAGFQSCTVAGNDCSLRGAILKANGAPDPSVIIVPAGTYTLTITGQNEDLGATGDLDIRNEVTILGAGVGATIVEGGPSTATGIDRVFHAVVSFGHLTLRDVTVRHGNTSGNGGGILFDGASTLERVHVVDNQGGFGGGLGLNGPSTVLDSTISGNTGTAAAGGGGISMGIAGSTIVITNATIAGNTATTGRGGGISQAAAASTTLNNVTLAGNTAATGGNGVSIAGGSIKASNAIVANNGPAPSSGCAGNLTTLGNNLVFGSTVNCGFSPASGDLVNTADPLLGPLQNNGGSAPTLAPGVGSPAIDAGNSGTPGTGGSACAARDQRGIVRPHDGDGAGGSRCDIGAVEVTAAGILVVDRTDDNAVATACTAAINDCSLRGAVIAANASSGRIAVPHGTYTLTIAGQNEDNAATGDLDIRRSVTIEGGGANSTIIQAGLPVGVAVDRVFEVINNGGQGSLSLRDAWVRNGRVAAAGGGIVSAGPLTLDRVAITDSQANNGGGLSVSDILRVRDSLVSGNRAGPGRGGGVFVASGVVATLTNVTLTENFASADSGGGLANNGSTTLNNVTVAGNTASQGGGIAAIAGTVTVRNTIVASNTVTSSNPNCSLPQNISSQGNNLVFGGDTCGFSASGDIQNQNPKLGALQDNGGPTSTMALGVASPAIDAGNSATPGGGGNACAAADQRGVSRPRDADGDGVARCDIGAYELKPIEVDRTDDVASASDCREDIPNDCSLRGAILKANELTSLTVIALPAGTYRLTITGQNEDAGATGDLDIRRNVALQGAGAATTIVEAGPTTAAGIDRVFNVIFNGGSGQLALRDVTVRNGNTAGTGGGILAGGALTLERVHVVGNQSNLGGGLELDASATILSSTVSGNTSVGGAGAGGLGLGIGGITAIITNTTIADNIATSGRGGGIGQVVAATTTLNNVTLAGNTAATGGNAVNIAGGSMNVFNTIVANNGPAPSSACANNLTTLGNNLVFGSTTSCGFSAASGDLVNTADPKLGLLKDNGGPTPTMALGGGSAAIDVGNNGAPGTGGSTCAATDQRGISRPQDGDLANGARCDIGAFEARVVDLCLLRPPVQVAVTSGGQNGLNVTVTRGLGPLTELRFHGAASTHVSAPNALVDIGGQSGRSGEFTFAPAANATSQQFAVRSANLTTPTTLPLEVFDACGSWATLVGGGTGVVGGGVGTFSLSGIGRTARVGETVTLLLQWAVPQPRVWRQLHSLELRLRDEAGVAWAVRWEEIGDTFTVTDARVPKVVTLNGPLTQGSGPTGQSVTLTLPLVVQQAGGGKTFTIEVKATDDLGTVQEFEPAGTLTVLAGPAPAAAPPDVGTQSENKDDTPRKLTEQERWQQAHTNAGSRDDERIEGDVLRVDCAGQPPTVTIGNRDGEVTVELRGEAVGDCGSIQPGQYLEARGEKVHEQRFIADRVNAE